MKTTANLAVDLDFESTMQKKDAFVEGFEADMASSLGIPADKVQIENLVAGSVKVDFALTNGPDGAGALDSFVQGGEMPAFSNLSKGLGVEVKAKGGFTVTKRSDPAAVDAANAKLANINAQLDQIGEEQQQRKNELMARKDAGVAAAVALTVDGGGESGDDGGGGGGADMTCPELMMLSGKGTGQGRKGRGATNRGGGSNDHEKGAGGGGKGNGQQSDDEETGDGGTGSAGGGGDGGGRDEKERGGGDAKENYGKGADAGKASTVELSSRELRRKKNNRTTSPTVYQDQQRRLFHSLYQSPDWLDVMRKLHSAHVGKGTNKMETISHDSPLSKGTRILKYLYTWGEVANTTHEFFKAVSDMLFEDDRTEGAQVLGFAALPLLCKSTRVLHLERVQPLECMAAHYSIIYGLEYIADRSELALRVERKRRDAAVAAGTGGRTGTGGAGNTSHAGDDAVGERRWPSTAGAKVLLQLVLAASRMQVCRFTLMVLK
jgi:hypothetical protein